MVISNNTIQYAIYDFLLVFHSNYMYNYMHSLYFLGYIARYFLKIANFYRPSVYNGRQR